MRTLREYFINDFRQYLNRTATHKIYDPIAKKEIMCFEQIQVSFDFDNCRKFLSIYIPKEADFLNLMRFYINDIPNILESESGEGFEARVYETVPQDSSKEQASKLCKPSKLLCSSKKLVFTNDVYAYVEGYIDEERKSKILLFAKEKGINLVLRGDEYAAEKNRLENPEPSKSNYNPLEFFGAKNNMPIPPLSLPSSIKEIEEAICELRSLDFKKATIEGILDKLHTFFIGYILSCPIFDPGLKVYRGVHRKTKPLKISEIKYPPKDKTKVNRVNRAGQPVFYCSSSFQIPFVELDFLNGDFVALSVWETKEKLLVNNIGYTQKTELWWNKERHPQQLTEEIKLIAKFFTEEFRKKIPEGEEHLYKMTIAIAEGHFSQAGFNGLLYPSVAMNANGDNLALKPEYVEQHLKCLYVAWIEILSAIDNSFKYCILDEASSFHTDGTIQWTGKPPREWSIKPRSGLQLRVVDGEWVAHDINGNPVGPEFQIQHIEVDKGNIRK